MTMPARCIATGLALLLLSACVASPASKSLGTVPAATTPPVVPGTYNGIDLPQPQDSSQEGAPQPAWLVVGQHALAARYAAFKTAAAQVDPALAMDFATVVLPTTADTVDLVIGPGPITKLEATLRPWSGTLIPLLDPHAHALKVDTLSSNRINSFTITWPFAESHAPTADQLLEVHSTFPLMAAQSSGEAYYVWLLKFKAN